MRAVILQHEQHEGLGLLGPVLTAAGYSLTKRFRNVEHADLGAELVVVLGGSMSANDVDVHPFIGAERAFLIERLALDKPTLGICLGSQLLAAAAGAEVFEGKNGKELTIGPVKWMKAAQEDPAFKGVGAKSLVAHWHGDTFTPVPGATLLASTDRYAQQAFRIGKAVGLQFHLELTGDGWLEWLKVGGLDVATHGKDVGKLRAAEPANTAVLERLVAALREG
ncbi:MAG: glutamine amidotransferase [Myxococcaceae bacterium]|nr:glutamine amidotransferase [Myxococcaceae bacterium]